MIGTKCKDRRAALRRWDRVHRLRAKKVPVREIARRVGIFPSHVSYILRQDREAVWRPGGVHAQQSEKRYRNEAIIERASEVPPPTLAALAQQFGISRQRVHAIVHRGRMARLEGGGSQS